MQDVAGFISYSWLFWTTLHLFSPGIREWQIEDTWYKIMKIIDPREKKKRNEGNYMITIFTLHLLRRILLGMMQIKDRKGCTCSTKKATRSHNILIQKHRRSNVEELVAYGRIIRNVPCTNKYIANTWTRLKLVRSQVLTVTKMKFTLFWDVEWCSPVEVYLRSKVVSASIIRVMSNSSPWCRRQQAPPRVPAAQQPSGQPAPAGQVWTADRLVNAQPFPFRAVSLNCTTGPVSCVRPTGHCVGCH
jgi:hypothetical protein